MLSVGRGIADITGEAADCGMLGYGKSDQRTAGIHQRLRSRAFVFRDDSQDGDARLLLIVAELPLPMQNVNEEVLRRLADLYGDTYSEQNTLITATHTHAGPGGYCGYLLYNLTTSGFRPATLRRSSTELSNRWNMRMPMWRPPRFRSRTASCTAQASIDPHQRSTATRRPTRRSSRNASTRIPRSCVSTGARPPWA